MLVKKISIMILLLTTSLFAHKVAGVDMSLERLEDDKILVNAFFSKSKRALIGNEVRLISMFDNRILEKGKLSKEGLKLNIPKESYWVYVLVRDNDIVKDGLAPLKGFQKKMKLEKVALLYTALATILFVFTAFFISYKKTRRFKGSF